MSKLYVDANQLLKDSFALARLVEQSGFIPTLVIGVWRGGAGIAVAVHEHLSFTTGCEIKHLPVKTSLYSGIATTESKVLLTGVASVMNEINHDEKVLIVDDVHDSGRSLDFLVETIRTELASLKVEGVQLKSACIYYKPLEGKVFAAPDYYLHETTGWIVFPHEMVGLTAEEISKKEV